MFNYLRVYVCNYLRVHVCNYLRVYVCIWVCCLSCSCVLVCYGGVTCGCLWVLRCVNVCVWGSCDFIVFMGVFTGVFMGVRVALTGLEVELSGQGRDNLNTYTRVYITCLYCKSGCVGRGVTT